MSLTLGSRRWVVVALGAVALFSATGVTAQHVFHQPSTLKYAVTVGGPLLLAWLFASTNPLAVMSALLVIAAPFAGYVMTFQGVRIPLLAPLLVLGAYCAALRGPAPGRRSALAAGGALMALSLVAPLIESPDRTGVLGTLTSLFVAAWLAARASSEDGGFIALAWAFLISAAIQAALALWQRHTGQALNLYGSAGAQTINYNGYFFGYLNTVRPPGAFYDPISLGNMLAIAVPLGGGLIVRTVRRREIGQVVIAALALVLVLAGLESTLDRMSWIGALAGLATTILLLPGNRRRRGLLATLIALGAVVLVAGLGGQSTPAQRAASILHPLNETGTGNGDVLRIQIWQRAVSTAEAHPITGIGLGRFQSTLAGELAPAGTQGHAHSTYLQLAAEGGLSALIGLLAVVLALRRDLRITRREDVLWGAVLTGAVLAMLVCWTTDVTIRYSAVATYMGILFGMVAGRARRAQALAQARAERRRPSAAA